MRAIVDPSGESPAPELVIARAFDVPPLLVFKAWTEPKHFVHWWGPKGFTIPFCKIDPCPGGVIHFCMRSPDGHDYWSKGIFCEVDEPERFVVIDYFSDEKGNYLSPADYGLSQDFPSEMLMTVTFEKHEGKTRLTMHQTVALSVAERNGAPQGWNESFDKLEDYLGKNRRGAGVEF
jgi:uncharacterized protein YndB with AHSA1/START domain